MSPRYELVECENLGYNLPQSLPYPSAKTIAGGSREHSFSRHIRCSA